MVYLTMTSTIVEALEKIQSLKGPAEEKSQYQTEMGGTKEGGADRSALGGSRRDEEAGDPESATEDGKKKTDSVTLGTAAKKNQDVGEPSLTNPKFGNPISHGQVIDLSRQLKVQGLSPRSLDTLLRGARVYGAPPPPKAEPTSEYKALMARLRREEESRSYERMIRPPPSMETFAQRFPMSSAAHAFPSYQEPEPEDEVTYAEINRQMAMIANVLLSIVACAGAIWVAARWWSTPARLALSMSGSLLVGVAEVVVYGGYIRRVSEAKGKEKGVEEIREVMRTWVVGGGEPKEENGEQSVLVETNKDLDDVRARRRKINI